jgi:hypothetical protein
MSFRISTALTKLRRSISALSTCTPGMLPSYSGRRMREPVTVTPSRSSVGETSSSGSSAVGGGGGVGRTGC